MLYLNRIELFTCLLRNTSLHHFKTLHDRLSSSIKQSRDLNLCFQKKTKRNMEFGDVDSLTAIAATLKEDVDEMGVSVCTHADVSTHLLSCSSALVSTFKHFQDALHIQLLQLDTSIKSLRCLSKFEVHFLILINHFYGLNNFIGIILCFSLYCIYLFY